MTPKKEHQQPEQEYEQEDDFEEFVDHMQNIHKLLKNLGVPHPRVNIQFPIVFHIGAIPEALLVAQKLGLYTEGNRIAFILESMEDYDRIIAQILDLKEKTKDFIEEKEKALSPTLWGKLKGIFSRS